MSAPLDLTSGWALSAALAVGLGGQTLHLARRRRIVNEALHELRRPLQSLWLLRRGEAPGVAGPADGAMQLALAALADLERGVNGGPEPRNIDEVPGRQVLEAAVGRWRARADLAGGGIRLRWRAGFAPIMGDRLEISRALDNLLANALEHGGPTIGVEASRHGARLRIAVSDNGRPRGGETGEASAMTRMPVHRRRSRRSGHSATRRGYGLAVVRRVAAAHGGRFALERSERGSVAVLELPISTQRPTIAA